MPDVNLSQSTPQAQISSKPFWKKPLFFAFLLIFGLILVASFIFFPSGLVKKYKIQTEIKTLSSQLEQTGDDESFIDVSNRTLLTILEKNNEESQYKVIFNLSQGVSAQYSKVHNPKLREFAESLKVFAQKNYPKYYNDLDLSVACSDEKCAKLEYKPEIQQIKDEAEKANLGSNKEGILTSLYQASLVPTKNANPDNERIYLSFALGILHNESQLGSADAGALEAKVLSYLKKTYPNYAAPWEATDSARRKIEGLQ